jgi:hypothetical protein
MNAPATASRRSLPDWAVDTLLFLVAVVVALLTGRRAPGVVHALVPAWLFPAAVIAGALGCAGLWLRRRWPVGLALVLVALSTFSELVAGAMVVAPFTVAVHRPRGPRRASTPSACWPPSSRLSCPRVVATHQRFLCHSLALPRTSSGVRPLVQRPVWARSVL